MYSRKHTLYWVFFSLAVSFLVSCAPSNRKIKDLKKDAEAHFVRENVAFSVMVHGLRNNDGTVFVSVCNNTTCHKDEKGFMTWMASDANEKGIVLNFVDFEPGSYTFYMLHDENQNEKMDFNDEKEVQPKEGWGFSRNALPDDRKPDWEQIVVEYDGTPQQIEIIAQYMGRGNIIKLNAEPILGTVKKEKKTKTDEAGEEIKPAELNVKVEGLRNKNGKIWLQVCASEDCHENARKNRKSNKRIEELFDLSDWKAVNANDHSFKIEKLDPGLYSIFIHHDENSDGVMDYKGVLPLEGFALSNDAEYKKGFPYYEDMAIELTSGGKQNLSVKMEYLLPDELPSGAKPYDGKPKQDTVTEDETPPNQEAKKGKLVLNVKDLPNLDGQLLVDLCATKKCHRQLIDDSPKKDLVIEKKPFEISNKEPQLILENVKFGKYSLFVYHDEDGNGEMPLTETAPKLPLEGFGFGVEFDPFEESRAPKFEQVEVDFRKDGQEVDVKIIQNPDKGYYLSKSKAESGCHDPSLEKKNAKLNKLVVNVENALEGVTHRLFICDSKPCHYERKSPKVLKLKPSKIKDGKGTMTKRRLGTGEGAGKDYSLFLFADANDNGEYDSGEVHAYWGNVQMIEDEVPEFGITSFAYEECLFETTISLPTKK